MASSVYNHESHSPIRHHEGYTAKRAANIKSNDRHAIGDHFYLHKNGQLVLPYVPYAYVQVNASKIADGLFIGNQDAGQDIEFITTNKITHIINCVGHVVPNLLAKYGVQYMTFRWTDTRTTVMFDKMGRTLSQIKGFIDEALNNSCGVLIQSVHGRCKLMIQLISLRFEAYDVDVHLTARSCCVVIGYLMSKFNWSRTKALEFVQFKRPDVEPKPYYWQQLRRVEKKLGIDVESEGIEDRWLASCDSVDEQVARNTFLNGHYIKTEHENENDIEIYEDFTSFDDMITSKTNRLVWLDQVATCNGRPSLPHRPPGSDYNSTTASQLNKPSIDATPSASILKKHKITQHHLSHGGDDVDSVSQDNLVQTQSIDDHSASQVNLDDSLNIESVRSISLSDDEDNLSISDKISVNSFNESASIASFVTDDLQKVDERPQTAPELSRKRTCAWESKADDAPGHVMVDQTKRLGRIGTSWDKPALKLTALARNRLEGQTFVQPSEDTKSIKLSGFAVERNNNVMAPKHNLEIDTDSHSIQNHRNTHSTRWFRSAFGQLELEEPALKSSVIPRYTRTKSNPKTTVKERRSTKSLQPNARSVSSRLSSTGTISSMSKVKQRGLLGSSRYLSGLDSIISRRPSSPISFRTEPASDSIRRITRPSSHKPKKQTSPSRFAI